VTGALVAEAFMSGADMTALAAAESVLMVSA
jgi:hypothetical protein